MAARTSPAIRVIQAICTPLTRLATGMSPRFCTISASTPLPARISASASAASSKRTDVAAAVARARPACRRAGPCRRPASDFAAMRERISLMRGVCPGLGRIEDLAEIDLLAERIVEAEERHALRRRGEAGDIFEGQLVDERRQRTPAPSPAWEIDVGRRLRLDVVRRADDDHARAHLARRRRPAPGRGSRPAPGGRMMKVSVVSSVMKYCSCAHSSSSDDMAGPGQGLEPFGHAEIGGGIVRATADDHRLAVGREARGECSCDRLGGGIRLGHLHRRACGGRRPAPPSARASMVPMRSPKAIAAMNRPSMLAV